jgi:hypothetical protein
MQMINIEAGVKHALKAFKLEAGMSEEQADAWVAANLAAGVARIKAAVGKSGLSKQRGRDAVASADAAFVELKTWAKQGS